MKKYELNIPKILYKYRDLKSGHAEKILSNGEIYFATTNQLADHKEKASFVMSKGAWVNDENNSLVYLSPEESKNRLMKAVRAGPHEPYGILSLCESREELLMHEQYADNFQGICIGFDWDKFNLYFAGSYPPVRNIPRCVIYQETTEIDAAHVTPEQWLEIFCSKLPKYSYEKECRLFYTKGKHVSEFVRQAIKEIIFGYKVSLDKILQVKALVGDLSGISFYIAQKIDNKVQIKNLNLEKCFELELD